MRTDLKHYSESEIDSLINRFEAKSLPKEEWTHQAHLVVSIWYCSKYTFEEALDLVRTKISLYNESLGNSNTDLDGYHESITKFWLLEVNQFLAHKSTETLPLLCEDFINSERNKSDYILKFYSREKLFSIEARHTWVPPDLKRIDEV